MSGIEGIFESTLWIVGYHPELPLLNSFDQIQLWGLRIKLIVQSESAVSNIDVLVLVLQVYVAEIPSVFPNGLYGLKHVVFLTHSWIIWVTD